MSGRIAARSMLAAVVWAVGASKAISAGVMPRDCLSRPFVLAIDVGHDAKAFGATSARGKPEFAFNLRFSRELLDAARAYPGLKARLLSPDRFALSLSARVALANALKPDLFISVHHDSAHRSLLKPWRAAGVSNPVSFDIAGYSIFLSRNNPRHRTAMAFAEAIGAAWNDAGHKPTLHHAADLPRERRKLLRPQTGVYLAPFAVIDRTTVPALLLEVGVLINPDEEAWLDDAAVRRALQGALLRAVVETACAGSKR